MEVTELKHAQAARWVWDSLWSTRRHARINILDAALFHEGVVPTTTTSVVAPTGVRWLFTAKDGRVMKKSCHNSSIGALKQALLSRVLLHGGELETNNETLDVKGGDRPIKSKTDSNAASGRIFATALMDSGDKVPLDEEAWTKLVVRNGGREGGALAVTALAPAGVDVAHKHPRCGGCTPQRFTCEYRLKPVASIGVDKGRTGGVATTPTKPAHISMTTYVLVSRGLLRDVNGNLAEPLHLEGEEKGAFDHVATGTHARADERLVSKVKATNREVEENLRRIVRWVQEVRRVRVLSMTATFSVVPSEASRGSHTPGVWLEQSLHVRMVSKTGKAAEAPSEGDCFAPIAEPLGPHGMQHQRSLGARDVELSMRYPSGNLYAGGAGHQRRCPPEEASPRKDNGDTEPKTAESEAWTAATERRRDNEKVMATAAIESDASILSAPSPSTARDPPASSLEQRTLSTAEMLGVAVDAVQSAGQASPTSSTLPQNDADSCFPIRQQPTAVGQQFQRQRLSAIGIGPEAKNAGIPSSADPRLTSRKQCGGDFCSCPTFSSAEGECSGFPENSPLEDRGTSREGLGGGSDSSSKDSGREAKEPPAAAAAAAELNWTDIGMCDNKDGAGLLQLLSKQQKGPSSSGDRDPAVASENPVMLFSVTFKSIGLARLEVERGRDSHWGEALRKNWRQGTTLGVAGGLENLSPALMYREVAVCRTCYDVYRRLDKLRERADRKGLLQGSSSFPSLLPSISKRQQGLQVSSTEVNAAAEVGALTLRAEVAKILEDVDARASKPRITEAGILWRRRIRKSKGNAVEEAVPTRSSQAQLVGKLARPKPLYSVEEGHIASSVQRGDRTATRAPSLDKRRVKSQGDIPDFADGDDSGNHDHHQGQRASASLRPSGGFPLLQPRHSHRRDPAGGFRQRQQRAAGPMGISTTTNKSDFDRCADSRRRILPHGAPRRGAWPMLDHDGTTTQDYYGGERRGFEGFGGDGDGGGGLGSGSGDIGGERSKETIRAIESMLEEGGGESYLPERARDLPEALTILGPPGQQQCSTGDRMDGAAKKRKRNRNTGAGVKAGADGRRRNKGIEEGINEAGGEAGRPHDATPDNQPSQTNSEDPRTTIGGWPEGRSAGGLSSRDGGGTGKHRVEERFLHPWQRALEANKRSIIAGREEHEAALAKEKQRRRDALGAAAASKDCRRAGKRVAARMGRQRRHRRRVVSGNYKRGRGKPGRERGCPGAHHGRREGEAQAKSGDGWHSSVEVGDSDHDENDDDYLHQMRDALGWARKTLRALLKRLQDRGIAVDHEALVAGGGGGGGGVRRGGRKGDCETKDWEVVRVVNKLRRRLAAFDDECVSFRVEAAAAAAAETAGVAIAARESSTLLVRSKGEAACELFETELFHLVDELIAAAKEHPSHPDLQLLPGCVEFSAISCASDGIESSGRTKPNGVPLSSSAASAVSVSAHGSKRSARASSFGLCPSCWALPVSRRCLDCDGEHADRDRCSSCFVREHRDAPRQTHRFLRVSGYGYGGRVGGGGGGDAAAGKAAEVVSTTVQNLRAEGGRSTKNGQDRETHQGSSADAPRCSSCGDLAAARRCLDCRVDTCAACHFLAHRSPSRQSHVTDLIGRTAVSVQEALYSRNRDSLSAASVAAVVRGETADGNVGMSGQAGGNIRDLREGAGSVPFGKDAAKSLAQVRRTIIDAPVVRPRSSQQRSSSKASGSVWCISGDAGGGDNGGANSDSVRDTNAKKNKFGEGDHASVKEEGGGRTGAVETPEDISVEKEGTALVRYAGAGSAEGDWARRGEIRGCDDEHHRSRWRGGHGEEAQVVGEGGMIGDEGPLEEIVHEDGVQNGVAAAALFGNATAMDGSDPKLSKRWEGTDSHREGQWREVGGVNEMRDASEGLGNIREEEEEEEETGSMDAAFSSSEEDSDEDEGMMWAPVNIAKVGVDPSESEAGTKTSPPGSPQEKSSRIESDDPHDDVDGNMGVREEIKHSRGLPPDAIVLISGTISAAVPDGTSKDAKGQNSRIRTPPARPKTRTPNSVGARGAGVNGIDSQVRLIPLADTPRSDSEKKTREAAAEASEDGKSLVPLENVGGISPLDGLTVGAAAEAIVEGAEEEGNLQPLVRHGRTT